MTGRWITKITVSIFAMALVGCSPEGEQTATQAPIDGNGSDSIKIGIALPAGNQMFWTAYQNAAKAEADRLGVEIMVTDAKNDANTQNEQIGTMIVSGVQGISIASVDPDANAQAAQIATDAGIPLISGNRLLSGEYGGLGNENPLVHVGFDDVLIGEEQGKMLIDVCADLDPCQVLLEEATSGSSSQLQRTEGLEEAIQNAPNITIVDRQTNDFDPTKALDVTQALLQGHPDVDVLMTQDDYTALAALGVIEEQGKDDQISVIGIGGSVDGVKAIADGRMYGTVHHSPSNDAAAAVETLVKIIREEGDEIEVDSSGDRPTVVVNTVQVTKENAAENAGEW